MCAFIFLCRNVVQCLVELLSVGVRSVSDTDSCYYLLVSVYLLHLHNRPIRTLSAFFSEKLWTFEGILPGTTRESLLFKMCPFRFCLFHRIQTLMSRALQLNSRCARAEVFAVNASSCFSNLAFLESVRPSRPRARSSSCSLAQRPSKSLIFQAHPDQMMARSSPSMTQDVSDRRAFTLDESSGEIVTLSQPANQTVCYSPLQSHPGTNVTVIDLFDRSASLQPMWKQVEGFKTAVRPIMQKATDGLHFICYSQGI